MELKIEGYENHLPYYNFTSKQIEEFCKTEEYKMFFFPLDKDDPDFQFIERTRIPSFAPLFFWGVDSRKGINRFYTQAELYNVYKAVYKNFFEAHITTNNLKQKVQGRIFRSYPSLVRDLHFSLYLKEKHGVENVIYNPIVDIGIGIDLLLKYNNKWYGLKQLVDTERSNGFKSIKDTQRQSDYDNIDFIVIPKKIVSNGVELTLDKHEIQLYGDYEYNTFIAPRINA